MSSLGAERALRGLGGRPGSSSGQGLVRLFPGLNGPADRPPLPGAGPHPGLCLWGQRLRRRPRLARRPSGRRRRPGRGGLGAGDHRRLPAVPARGTDGCGASARRWSRDRRAGVPVPRRLRLVHAADASSTAGLCGRAGDSRRRVAGRGRRRVSNRTAGPAAGHAGRAHRGQDRRSGVPGLPEARDRLCDGSPPRDLPADDYPAARCFFERLEHPTVGPLAMPGPAAHLSRTSPVPPTPAPRAPTVAAALGWSGPGASGGGRRRARARALSGGQGSGTPPRLWIGPPVAGHAAGRPRGAARVIKGGITRGRTFGRQVVRPTPIPLTHVQAEEESNASPNYNSGQPQPKRGLTLDLEAGGLPRRCSATWRRAPTS